MRVDAVLLQQPLHRLALGGRGGLCSRRRRREVAGDEQLAARHVARHVATDVARDHDGAALHPGAERPFDVARDQ